MKNNIFFCILFCGIPFLLCSQDLSDEKPRKSVLQIGINASHLLGELTKIQPSINVRTNPYDLQFNFFPTKKVSIRLGLGYETPPEEVDGGAIDGLELINFTVHARLSLVWNYHFFDHWTLSTGPELAYTRTIDQAFDEGYPIKDIVTNFYAIGVVSNLQYSLSSSIALGVEIAMHNGIIYRDQRFPNTSNPFFFDFEPNILDATNVRSKFYAPIELFAYYQF